MGQDFDADDVNILPKEKRPPKGCKEYFFNEGGEYSTDKMLISETIFKCFAINNKSALKKFNKFIKSKN